MVPPPTGSDALGSWECWQGKTNRVSSGLFTVGVSQAMHHVDWQAGDLDLGGELVSVWFRLVGTLRTKLAGN